MMTMRRPALALLLCCALVQSTAGLISLPTPRASGSKKMVVLGGSGFVGRKVCEIAVGRGWDVTSLSRRGENPLPSDAALSQVTWLAGDATDPSVVSDAVRGADAAVHAIGLLFDASTPGGGALNLIVSGSGSKPGPESTYDNITRRTAANLIAALKSRFSFPGTPPTPLAFVSAAEAGWPEVKWGPEVEANVAPGWLVRYLAAKREVEAQLRASPQLRTSVFRPSLIWDWSKLDVLPIIPVFNLASALGVPFVDKTVRVETLAGAIVAALEDPAVSGVKRFPQMEELAPRVL